MGQRTINGLITIFAIVLVSTTVARAQSTTPEISLNPHDTWEDAQLAWSSGSERKLVVVTADKPDRRQGCRVQWFEKDKLVCKRAIGGPRTYDPRQVVALILPGDNGLRLPLWLGFNAGLGMSIWGTVVLTAACPACAVGTGIAALFFLGAAGAVLIGDDQPDRLLYRAPGRHLSHKLGYVQR